MDPYTMKDARSLKKGHVRRGAMFDKSWRSVGHSVLLAGVFSLSSLSCLFLSDTMLPEPREINCNFDLFPVGQWRESQNHDLVFVNFIGGGMIGIEIDSSARPARHVLFQSPAISHAPEITHACLVTTDSSFNDFKVEVTAKTIAQLRLPMPNPWEAAWIIWRHVDNTHFYYFMLKTNGWELGKADPSCPGTQRFLKTGGMPKLTLGQYNRIGIRQVGKQMTVSVDGNLVVSFLDEDHPHMAGRIGFYSEDAYVHFSDFSIVY